MARRSAKEDPLVNDLESLDAGLVAAATPSPGRVETLPIGMKLQPLRQPRDLPLHVPYMAGGTGYSQRHLDMQLTEPQALALRGILDALDSAGARLANGRRVINAPDAIRWLLEETQVLAAGGKTDAPE